MSNTISPSLPLKSDEQDGFKMNKTILQAVKQNVKMILLTIPGERIMDPDFGVGLKRYLFNLNDSATYGAIRSRINQQIDKYMPFVEIEELEIFRPELETPSSENSVQVILSYRISPIDSIDSLVMDF